MHLIALHHAVAATRTAVLGARPHDRVLPAAAPPPARRRRQRAARLRRTVARTAAALR